MTSICYPAIRKLDALDPNNAAREEVKLKPLYLHRSAFHQDLVRTTRRAAGDGLFKSVIVFADDELVWKFKVLANNVALVLYISVSRQVLNSHKVSLDHRHATFYQVEAIFSGCGFHFD